MQTKRVISAYNDLTEQDQVMMNWKAMIRKSQDDERHEAVNRMLELASKDILVLLAVLALVITAIVVLASIWAGNHEAAQSVMDNSTIVNH